MLLKVLAKYLCAVLSFKCLIIYKIKKNQNNKIKPSMDWLTAFLLLTLLLLLWISARRPPNFPPGLRRLPLIGTIPKGSKPIQTMKHLNIVGLFIFNYPAIMIQNFKLAKELLNREEWCGRHSNIISKYLRSDSGKNKVSIG